MRFLTWVRGGGVERRLRAGRPRARRAFVAGLAGTVAPERVPRMRPLAAAGVTAALLVAFASVGGVGYAASTVKRVAAVATQGAGPVGVAGSSAGGDQYRPGYGFGDPNHNHTGPPGVKAKPGAPTTRSASGGKARVVSTSFTVDEQAALRIAVVDANGWELLLTQNGSRIDRTLPSGRQTKTIYYTVLVPRSIALALRIPGNLLVHGALYRVRVIAVDPDGNRTTLYIPFRG